MKPPLLLVSFMAALAAATAFAEDAPPANAPDPKIRYKAGKDVNFEELLIQGQLKRPEVTVVTGNQGQGTDGMLRLRENFIDRLAEDAGEEAAQ